MDSHLPDPSSPPGTAESPSGSGESRVPSTGFVPGRGRAQVPAEEPGFLGFQPSRPEEAPAPVPPKGPGPQGIQAPIPPRGPVPPGIQAPIPPRGPVPPGIQAPIPPKGPVPQGIQAPIPPKGPVPPGIQAPIPPRGPVPQGIQAPIPPRGPVPPGIQAPIPPRGSGGVQGPVPVAGQGSGRVPSRTVVRPTDTRRPASYRPPAPMESRPVYVDPKLLFGALGAAVLLLVGLAVWKNMARNAAAVGSQDLELRAGRDVRKNLSGSEWATLSLPTALGADSLLKTGQDRQNVLALSDGSTVRMDRGTSVKIVGVTPSGKGQKVRLLLYRGRIFVNEHPDSDVQVETKYVTVSPIGTRFAVSQVEQADLSEYSTVRVVEGTVRVTHLEDKDATLVVKAGEQATAGASVLESPKVASANDEWVAWNSSWTELDQMVGVAAPSAGQAPDSTSAPSGPSGPPGGQPPQQAPPPEVHQAPPPPQPPVPGNGGGPGNGPGRGPGNGPGGPPPAMQGPDSQPQMPTAGVPRGQGGGGGGGRRGGGGGGGRKNRPMPPGVQVEDAQNQGIQQPQQPPPVPGVPVPGQPRPAVEDASNDRIPGFNAPGAGAAPPPGAPGAPGAGGGPGSGALPTVVEPNKNSYPMPAPTSNQGPAGY